MELSRSVQVGRPNGATTWERSWSLLRLNRVPVWPSILYLTERKMYVHTKAWMGVFLTSLITVNKQKPNVKTTGLSCMWLVWGWGIKKTEEWLNASNRPWWCLHDLQNSRKHGIVHHKQSDYAVQIFHTVLGQSLSGSWPRIPDAFVWLQVLPRGRLVYVEV